MIPISSPPRILLKRALAQALHTFSDSYPDENFHFLVTTDHIGEISLADWDKHPRIVDIFLESFINEGSFTGALETITFNIVSAVAAQANDYTQGVDGVSFLLDQVRAALWGAGDKMGISSLDNEIKIASYSNFNATLGSSIVEKKELLIVYAQTKLEITINVQEYENYTLRSGQGVNFKGEYYA